MRQHVILPCREHRAGGPDQVAVDPSRCGALVADLILQGASSDANVPHTDFTWSRFDDGRLLRTPYTYFGAGER